MTFQEIINQNKPVVVDFFATWCGPCKMVTPILEDVKKRVGDNAAIVKIDVDKNQSLAAKYGIQSIPTLMLFKEGKMLWRQTGVVPSQQLINKINEHI